MSPYDYKGLHRLLLSKWSNRIMATDDEVSAAASALTDIEFVIWKFCQTGAVPPKAREVADYLTENGLTAKTTDHGVRVMYSKIRKKGFAVRCAPNTGGHRPFSRDISIAKGLAEGMSYSDLSEVLRMDRKTIKQVTMKWRKQYPQFHLGNVAKTRT